MQMETERKTRLVTQLDEDAVCRSIGYAACKHGVVWFAGGVHFYTCSIHVAWTEQLYVCGAEWRHYVWLPSCCSTSPRLSSEIRSQASVSPLLLSSSPYSSLILSACPLIFYLSMVAHILMLSPVTDSLFFQSLVFMQPSAKPKHLPASLFSMIKFHSSPSFSLYVSSLIAAFLSMLISVIRLWGISWD